MIMRIAFAVTFSYGSVAVASARSAMPSEPQSATVLVLDLTASNGLRALQCLQPSASPDTRRWRGTPLVGLGRAVLLDWERLASDALPDTHAQALGIYVLVGPGNVHLLRSLMSQLSAGPPVCWLLMPNALLESSLLRAHARDGGQPLQMLSLPTSDPQALWLILLEQIDKLALAANAPLLPTLNPGDPNVSSNLKTSIDQAMTIEGALVVALVDANSGMCLAHAGSGINIELAAAGNTQVVRAKLKTMETLGLRSALEDILITLQNQYHLIRLVPNHPGLFLYLVLDKQRGNLALARYRLTEIERGIKV